MEEKVDLLNDPELKKALEQIQKVGRKITDPYKKYVYKLAVSKEGEPTYIAAKLLLHNLGVGSIQIERRKSVWTEASVDTTEFTSTVLLGFIRIEIADGKIIGYGIRDTSPLTIKKLYEIRSPKSPNDPRTS